MNCNEAAEFVSALCDGERIPPAAAAHVGECEACRARMREYIEMGAEMRRMASLEFDEEAKPLAWATKRNSISTLWQKGWETMRIPRFAFVALVLGVVALGSTLAVVKVRAHSEGSVVILAVNQSAGEPIKCPLSTVNKNQTLCAAWSPQGKNMVGYEINLLGRDGSRVQLGVRARVYPLPMGAATKYLFSDFAQVEQKDYWFEPGETLHVDVAGSEPLTMTGEWTDHIPPPGALNSNSKLDPGPLELRINSPVLLRDKKVIADWEGAVSTADEANQGVVLAMKDVGRFTFALQPLQGGIKGRIEGNRILFESEGHSYTLLSGVFVARGEDIWILYDPKFKLEDGSTAWNGVFGIRDLLVPATATN